MKNLVKAFGLVGVVLVCALGSVAAAQAQSSWVRGCGNGGLNSPYLRWQVSRIHVGMSAATAAAISPHLGGQEFHPDQAGVPPRQVPCLVAQEAADTFQRAYGRWPSDSHWLNVTATAYGGSLVSRPILVLDAPSGLDHHRDLPPQPEQSGRGNHRTHAGPSQPPPAISVTERVRRAGLGQHDEHLSSHARKRCAPPGG